MSVAKYSMVPDMKMDFAKLLGVMYFSGAQTPVGVMVTHLGMSSATIVQWYGTNTSGHLFLEAIASTNTHRRFWTSCPD